MLQTIMCYAKVHITNNIIRINFIFIYIQVWIQKCAVQKASVDVNISFYYLYKKKIMDTGIMDFFLVKK